MRNNPHAVHYYIGPEFFTRGIRGFLIEHGLSGRDKNSRTKDSRLIYNEFIQANPKGPSEVELKTSTSAL